MDEAKSVYPFMAIGANIALVIAGCYIRTVNSMLPQGGQLLGLRVLVGTVLAMSAAMFASKAYIDSRVLAPAALAKDAAAGKSLGKKKKKKGSVADSIEVLKNSPKIRNLALLVMSYGVGHRCGPAADTQCGRQQTSDFVLHSIVAAASCACACCFWQPVCKHSNCVRFASNMMMLLSCRLFEFSWKGQLRTMYPTVQGYQSVLADVSTYTGVLTLASMFVSRLIFQNLGWGVAASITPAMMGIAGDAHVADQRHRHQLTHSAWLIPETRA